MTMHTTEDVALLEENGWVKLAVRSLWCWSQPKTNARFRFEDAVEYQRAINRNKRGKDNA